MQDGIVHCEEDAGRFKVLGECARIWQIEFSRKNIQSFSWVEIRNR